ncbi:ABC transporter permease, partial [Streptomyces sp. H28]|nr:ABC transporter permease [Streptomyces sp. H28]
LRPDLAARPVADLVAPLGRAVPAYGLPLSDAPRRLPLRVRLTASGPGTPAPVALSVHLTDADGLAHVARATLDVTGGAARAVRLDLPDTDGLRVVQLGLDMTGETVRRTYRLTVDRVPGLTRPARWHDVRPDAPDRHAAGCPGARPSERHGSAPGPVLCSDRAAPAPCWTRCCAARTPR